MIQQQQLAQKSLKIFAIAALIVQIILSIFFCFVQLQLQKIDNIWTDLDVFTLIGFGFLISYIKGYSYSAIIYVFFINVFVYQLNIILSGTWKCIFKNQCFSLADHQNPHSQQIFFKIDEQILINASYGVFSVLIAFAGVFGKIGLLQIFILSIVGSIGYTLSQALIKYVVNLQKSDIFIGNANIYVFGALYGIILSCLINKKIKGQKQIQTTYISFIMSIIGALFLLIYWPSFNAGNFLFSNKQHPYDHFRSYVIINTIFSLTSSCLGTFAMASFLKDKYYVQDLIFGSLTGGIIISSPAIIIGQVQNIGYSLSCGFIIGLISTALFIKLNTLQHSCNNYTDTFGLLSIFGIPGIISTIVTIIILFLKKVSVINIYPLIYMAISIGISCIFSIIAYFLIYFHHNLNVQSIYDQNLYFKVPIENQEQQELQKLNVISQQQ